VVPSFEEKKKKGPLLLLVLPDLSGVCEGKRKGKLFYLGERGERRGDGL